ncbi:MAG: hypothetical protein Q9217_002303 [Psora testacea]
MTAPQNTGEASIMLAHGWSELATTPTASSAADGLEESESAITKTESSSQALQKNSQLIYVFAPEADSPSSGDSAERGAKGGAKFDKREVVEYANKAKHDLFSALSTVRAALGEKDPDILGFQWEDAELSSQPSPSLESCWLNITRGLELTKALLEHQRTTAPEDSNMLDLTKALATASREPGWRYVFGEFSILGFYLEALRQSAGQTDAWMQYALRLVANCCLDGHHPHKNRQRTLRKAPFEQLVKHLLREAETAELAMNVLYSICDDYEPAQVLVQECYQLTVALLDCLEHGRLGADHMYQVCELMAYAPEKIDVSLLDSGKISVLLNAPSRYNISTENMEWLTTVLVAILKQKDVQKRVLEGPRTNLSRLMTFFFNTYDTTISNAATTKPTDVESRNQLAEDVEIMTASRVEIIQTLLAIAQVQVDSTKFRADLPTMISWIQGPEPQIRICANLFIGTLLYSQPEMRQDITGHPQLGQNLAQCFYCCRDREVLTSAFDLLNNLGTAPESRLILGKANILHALVCCQWQDNVDILTRQKAFYHVRQLLKGCLPNVYDLLKLTEPLPPNVEGEKTLLHALLVVFSETRDLAVKVEIGRSIAEALRTIHGSSSAQDIRAHIQDPIEDLEAAQDPKGLFEYQVSPRLLALAVRQSFMRHPQITEPILVLIESSNAALMTEGWLVMAFMSMWKEGAQAVYETLFADNTCQMLRSVVQSSDPQSKARANARYVVAELRNKLAGDKLRLEKLETLVPQDGARI